MKMTEIFELSENEASTLSEPTAEGDANLASWISEHSQGGKLIINLSNICR